MERASKFKLIFLLRYKNLQDFTVFIHVAQVTAYIPLHG